MGTELTHARHDRSHCLAPGLFRSLRRGARKKEKLDVSYRHGKEQIRFIGFEPLGADDLRLLQGIVALAGPAGVTLSPAPSAEVPKELRRLLETKQKAEEMNALMVSGNVGRLLAETGMTSGGKNIEVLKASLVRLSNVSVIASRGEQVASFRLLSFAFDGGTGQLHVGLNPRLADAVVGNRPYARIDMREVRRLKSDVARLIHQRLCGFVNPGKPWRVGLSVLSSYVWPEGGTAATMRQRRLRVRKALREISACGWTVEETARNMFWFRRPNVTAGP
jgi:hypothetical protein